MYRIRNLIAHLQRARRLRPSLLFLWRELVRREDVMHIYRLRNTGQPFHLRHRTQDLTGFTEVFVRGNYDFPRRVEYVIRSVPEPLRAVDLGANIGLFGLRLLARRPDARILAVEPDSANAYVLRATVAKNNPSAWSIIEACAAESDGTVSFRHGRFLESQIAGDGASCPAVDVLPALASADLIKIDIEGAERAILEDPRFAQVKARVVVLEYHPPHPRAQITRLLAMAGYTIEPFEERMPGYGELWAWKSADAL